MHIFRYAGSRGFRHQHRVGRAVELATRNTWEMFIWLSEWSEFLNLALRWHITVKEGKKNDLWLSFISELTKSHDFYLMILLCNHIRLVSYIWILKPTSLQVVAFKRRHRKWLFYEIIKAEWFSEFTTLSLDSSDCTSPGALSLWQKEPLLTSWHATAFTPEAPLPLRIMFL